MMSDGGAHDHGVLYDLFGRVVMRAFGGLGFEAGEMCRILVASKGLEDEFVQVVEPVLRRLLMSRGAVYVPSLTADSLMEFMVSALALTWLDPDYQGWDFYSDVNGCAVAGLGKGFNVLIVSGRDIKPHDEESVSLEYARAYLRDRGYSGHVGGFISWRCINPLLCGSYLSIPEDDACWHHPDGRLFAPSSYFDKNQRVVDHRRLLSNLELGESVVGFRAIS